MQIIESLSASQRKEFEEDLIALYKECDRALNGKLERLKDVTVNMRLENEVFLRVTCEYDNTVSGTEEVKGRITDIYQYSNRDEYDLAVAEERSSLN